MMNLSQNSSEVFDDSELGSILFKIIPSAMIILGIIGNIFSIIVFTRSSARSIQISSCLTVLAVSDLITLSGLLRYSIRALFLVDIYLNEVGCKLHQFLLDSSMEFSSWILVILTVQRAISVCYPYKARTICTKKKTNVFICITSIALLAINSHLLYGVTLKRLVDSDGNLVLKYCGLINKQYAEFYVNMYERLEIVRCSVYCFIPGFVITSGNILIIVKVLRSKMKSNSQNLIRRQLSLCLMLTTLNTVFILSTLPYCILRLCVGIWWKDASEDERKALILLSRINWLIH
jgi:hypothetical protein